MARLVTACFKALLVKKRVPFKGLILIFRLTIAVVLVTRIKYVIIILTYFY